MTSAKRRFMWWLLRGGAFLAVIVTCGCTRYQTAEVFTPMPALWGDSQQVQSPDAAAAAAAPAVAVVSLGTASSAQPPRFSADASVFGQWDGAAAQAGKAQRVAGGGQVNFEQHTYLDDGRDSQAAVDPTGKWIVFTSTRHSQFANIYLQRTDGLSVVQLTDDQADCAFPAFRPDGKEIAYCSNRSGNWDIYTSDVDGKNVRQITSGLMQEVHPSYSPTGDRLVYCSLSPRSGQWELWTISLSTLQRKMIGYGLFPRWSPDQGTDRIAFQKARARGSRWFSLWTLDLVNGEAARVTEVVASSNAAIVSPSWSPDGRKIAFATVLDPGSASGAHGEQDIWVIDADGSNRHRLTDGSAMSLMPFWAADNRVYFVSDRTGAECIWSVAADSTTTGNMAAGAQSTETQKTESADTQEVGH